MDYRRPPEEFNYLMLIKKYLGFTPIRDISLNAGAVIESESIEDFHNLFSKIKYEDKKYGLIEKTNEEHEYGNGGYRNIITILSFEGIELIKSINYVSWDSSLDDSEEYRDYKIEKTYLFSDDKLARLTFKEFVNSELKNDK